MKVKIITAAILLISSSFVNAQGGGLGIDNVQRHMDVSRWAQTNGTSPQVIPQGPIDKFDTKAQPETTVDTNQYKHSYDGQANNLVAKSVLLAGRPNFIRYLRRRA